jgi:hypothetical protein
MYYTYHSPCIYNNNNNNNNNNKAIMLSSIELEKDHCTSKYYNLSSISSGGTESDAFVHNPIRGVS